MSIVTPAPACSYDLGFLRICVLHSDGRSASIPPWLSDPDADDALYVAIHGQGHGSDAAVQGRQEPCPYAGDIEFCDPQRSEFPLCGHPCAVTILRLPRRSLGIAESDLRGIHGVRLACAEGAHALVVRFLPALVSEAGRRPTRIRDRLARSAVDLLAVLVTEWALEHRAEVTDEKAQTLAHIRDFIELHLADPDLSPDSIASAHHISVRYLHKLFQSEGVTVSQWVRQRRLEACQKELGLASRHLTVAAVARRWGFASHSHFSRAFRAAYGVPPSEWQRAGRRPAAVRT
ncbi:MULTISPECIES: helix-turn-helix domain-containing protein [Streptomyces]|uniref:helix-turn-helix domain-containing protein n=1 Tax=Streptomyces TaxID=1883 RepID=UPI001152D190|nr:MULTISPECIES: AraC family transcriptional regulator [Streptomyces]TQJ56905.1 AraC-like DNA-binding protein [Streptomyces sp. SLBN-115]